MSEFVKEYQTSILTKEGLFTLKEYSNENELERLVVSNASKIFGTHSIYFDIKHRIESKAKMRVADGLLLDLHNKMFWIVEHELSKHDPYKEIEPQINGFLRALSNEETIAKVSDTVYNELKKDRKKLALVNKTFGEDVHYSITKMLRERCGILIVIDKITPQIEELREEFASKKDTMVIEFKTYQKDSKMIYAFTPLALEKVPPKGKEERKQWNEQSFLEDAKTRLSDKHYKAVELLYDFSRKHADEISWGTGVGHASFNPKFFNISKRSLYSVYSDGVLTLNFEWLNDSHMARKYRDSFMAALSKIKGIQIPQDYKERRPSVPVDKWAPIVNEIIKVVQNLIRR